MREGGKVGLIINCAKTEMINMSIANPKACVNGGRVVKQVEKFKYLGTLLSMDGSLKVEFELAQDRWCWREFIEASGCHRS